MRKRIAIPRMPVFAIAALALFILLAALWLRSPRHSECLVVYSPEGNWQGAASVRGGIMFVASSVPAGRDRRLSAQTFSLAADELQALRDSLFDPTVYPVHLLGFHAAHGLAPFSSLTAGWRYHAVIIPYWALLLLLAGLPAQMVRGPWIRWRRRRRGACAGCGFDLRATPDRCPECGMGVSGAVATSGRSELSPTEIPNVAGLMKTATALAVVITCSTLMAIARSRGSLPGISALDAPIRSFTSRDVRLQEAMELVHRESGVSINLDPSCPVDLLRNPVIPDVQMRNTTARAVLEFLFAKWRVKHAIQFTPTSGAVRVSLGNQASTFVRAYPVGDILRKLRYSEDRDHGSILGSGAFDENSAAIGQALKDLVQDACDTDSWRDNGGEQGDIEAASTMLLVRQTWEGHRAVANLLAELRGGEGAWTIAPNFPLLAEGERAPVAWDAPLPALDLHDATVEEGIRALSRESKTDIAVQWELLQRVGVDREQRITLHIEKTTIGRALAAILGAGGATPFNYFQMRSGTIVVGSVADVTPPVVEVRLYDVRDLIEDYLSFEKAHRQLLLTGPVADRLKSSSMQPTEPRDSVSLSDAVEGIVNLLEATVATDTWKDNGGDIGVVREIGGRLLITQTPENHSGVVAALRVMRAGGGTHGTAFPAR